MKLLQYDAVVKMFERSSLCLTDFTPLSVRLTTSGWLGVVGACCAKSSAGPSKIPPATIALSRPATPLPSSLFPLPASRLPPPARLQPFHQRVVARRRPTALDEPFHRRTGRHLLKTASQGVDML